MAIAIHRRGEGEIFKQGINITSTDAADYIYFVPKPTLLIPELVVRHDHETDTLEVVDLAERWPDHLRPRPATHR